MSNLIPGLLTISLCAIGYFISWKSYRKNDFKTAVWLLIFCGFILRLFIASDLHLHEWDERYHALVAKNLMHHPFKPLLYKTALLPFNYTNWTANHIWLHKQPLPLWTMAYSMWLFGANEIALRLPSILLSTIGIGISYFIGKSLFNRNIGYFTAFLFSLNGLILELTAGRAPTDHIDIFFLFFVALAVAFCILFLKSGKTIFNALTGISIGAAILCKWLPALIVLPVWLLLVFDARKFKMIQIISQFFLIIIVCAAVVLPWQVYIFQVFPKEAIWEAGFNAKHFFEVLNEQPEPFYYFLNQIRINYGELIYLPLVWFCIIIFKKGLDKKRLAILIWFLIPLLFFSIAKTKMQGYLLFTAPALFLMTADFFYYLISVRKDFKIKWIINIGLGFLIVLPVRYCIERLKAFEPADRNPHWAKDLRKLNDEHIQNGILFNYSRPIEAMFYTDLLAYSYIPSNQILAILRKKGYTIIINDHGKSIPVDAELPDFIATVNLND